MSDQIFNADTETAILSIILKNPEKVFELNNTKEFMFSSTANQLLYTTIINLANQGLSPEITLIHDTLKAKNKDLQVGGKEYLTYLITQEYDPNNLREFERLLMESHKAKTLISIAGAIPGQIASSREIDQVIGTIRSALDNLTDTAGGDATSSLGDILKSSWDEIVDRTKNPGIRGVTTGVKGIDLATSGVTGGELWTIAGRPGMGKTAWECNVALSQAKKQNPILIFSLEMRKNPLVERMLSIDTGVNSTNIKLGLLAQEEMDKISDSMKRIKDLPIYIDSNYNANLAYVMSTIRRFKKMYDIKVVYLDYIQLLSERSADATNEIGRMTRAFKLVANELDIGIIMLSQLSRNCEYRDDKRPILSDLRQSGNIEEDSDIVIGLYRDEIYNKDTTHKGALEQIILKQRSGPIGTVLTVFSGDTNRISEK